MCRYGLCRRKLAYFWRLKHRYIYFLDVHLANTWRVRRNHLCGVLSLNFKLLQTTMRCVFIFSPKDSSKRGTIGIDTHPGTVLYLQTTCHTSNLLTQDQYTLIPSLMPPHFRFRSPSLNWMVLQSTLKTFFSVLQYVSKNELGYEYQILFIRSMRSLHYTL